MATNLPQPDTTSTTKTAPEINHGSVEFAPQASAEADTSAKAARESFIAQSQPGNSRRKADRFFSLSDRLPVQIFNEETKFQQFSHLGPTLIGIASLFLTGLVWVNTRDLTKVQLDIQQEQLNLQQRQMALQSKQVEAELADMRFKFLSDLTATDENKKTPAEIALAAHGLEAFPVVHYALGVEQGDIRRSAVNVVYRLFQAEEMPGREKILDWLMKEFDSPNKTLHAGVVQSFVKLEPLLNSEQRRKVIAFFQQQVVPQNTCSEQGGREVVLEAAKFVGSQRGDAIFYLLSILKVPRCGDAWLQAMYNLQNVAPKMSEQERSSVREQVSQIKSAVLGNLEQHISEEELAEGTGFNGFLDTGDVSVTFEKFKKRIGKEFDSLSLQMGQKL